MTNKIIYLLFNDGEGEEETKVEDNEETVEEQEDKEETLEETPKKEPKKTIKRTTKKVQITEKEFEEYKKFKLSSMSAEEREKALKDENESLLTKIGVLEKTIDTQTKEIERVKAQDSIKDELNKIRKDKPYLTETLDKRANKGFNNLEEVNEFINMVDSNTLKEAYEVLQKTQRATKISKNDNVDVNRNIETRKKGFNINLSKYGLRK